MKKIFCILSILTIISPVFAEGETPAAQPVPGTPTSVDPAGTGTTTTNPGYALATQHDTDANAATAGYVKGAYNATIKAVNTVASIKQDKLNNTNVVNSGSGAIVTGVAATKDSNNNYTGGLTVTKAEVTIPTSLPSGTPGNNRAFIWVQ